MKTARKRRRSFDNYKPVTNHLVPHGASINGWMFETYGEEYEFVKHADQDKVWTVIDGEGSKLYVVAGWHFVNRLGYIITELPWENGTEEYII